MVENSLVGINYSVVDEKLIELIKKYNEKTEINKNIYKFYKENFSYESYLKEMDEVILKCMD